MKRREVGTVEKREPGKKSAMDKGTRSSRDGRERNNERCKPKGLRLRDADNFNGAQKQKGT